MTDRREQFDLTPDLAQLDAELSRAMPCRAPDDLADRVYEASAPELARVAAAESELVRDLATELAAAPAPPGLADRVFAATVHHLPKRQRVLRRVGWAGRAAIAAGLLLAVMLTMWTPSPEESRRAVTATTPTVASQSATTATITQEEIAAIQQELAQLERTLGDPTGSLDAQILALAVELDSVSFVLDTDAGAGSFAPTVDQLQNELLMLEAEIRAF